MDELTNLKRKVDEYKGILGNTIVYREAWKGQLRNDIIKQLKNIIKQTKLPAKVDTKESIENLEAIVLNLGQTKSGLYEKLNADVQRHLIKHNGSLIYQQLFNGKIVVMLVYPFIEGYGEPSPPKQIGIYRPEEIKPPFIVRHMEEFIKEMSHWEDYDDDDDNGVAASQRIGFKMNLGDQLIMDDETE